MIDGRSVIEGMFQGRVPERPVASIRLDLWHQAAQYFGNLPEEISGMSCEEVQDYLGFARAARFSDYVTIRFNEALESTERAGDTITRRLELPGRTLTTVSRLTRGMAAAGMRPHIVKYPLETDEDYHALIRAYRAAQVPVNEEGFVSFDRSVGSAGLPMLILGPCPAHRVALEYLGYQRFYLDLVDRPGLVKELIRAMEDLWRTQVWPRVARSSAQLVLHGAHFSSSITPPPIFAEHFAPYFEDFNTVMHDAGKWTAFHGDADLGRLTREMPGIGFDCGECLATTPLVQESMDDYLQAWNGRIIAWGGLPSVVFQPEYPRDRYGELVKGLVEMARGRHDLIIGASDNVMPGAEWGRLLFLAEAICA